MSWRLPTGLSERKTARGGAGGSTVGSPASPVSSPRPPPGAKTIVLLIDDPLACADARWLYERVRVVLECNDADLVVCDVRALNYPDVGAVDVLARVALAARRCRLRFEVRHACVELQRLLGLMGLSDVVPTESGASP